jgi:hypothetical protein
MTTHITGTSPGYDFSDWIWARRIGYHGGFGWLACPDFLGLLFTGGWDVLWNEPVLFPTPAVQTLYRGRTWGWPLPHPGGGDAHYQINGLTNDGSSNPINGCVVTLFRTADNAVLGVWNTDSAGNKYIFWVEDNTTRCFCVAYKAGSPDVVGCTVNVLQGA